MSILTSPAGGDAPAFLGDTPGHVSAVKPRTSGAGAISARRLWSRADNRNFKELYCPKNCARFA